MVNNTPQIFFEDQEGILKRKFKRYRKSNFLTDIQIIGQDGSVFIHKMVILQKLPRLAEFLCDICDHMTETTFILPEVSKSDLEKQVKNLYTFGIVSGVKELLGFASSNSNKIKSEDQEEITPSIGDTDAPTIENDNKCENMQINVIKADEESSLEHVKFDNKYIKEWKQREGDEEHSLDLIPGNSITNPGLLIVDKKYKFSYNRVINTTSLGTHLYYRCSFFKKSKTSCRAAAVLITDPEKQNLLLSKCASDDEHNHEASEAEVVASKMKKEMVEMVKIEPRKSSQECMNSVVEKYAAKHFEETVWRKVLEILARKEGIMKLMQRTRKLCLEKEDITEGKKIAIEMVKEMGKLIKTNASVSPVECIEIIKTQFSQLNLAADLWEEVLKNLPKKCEIVKNLRRQRDRAMGLNKRFLSHYKIIIDNKDTVCDNADEGALTQKCDVPKYQISYLI